MFTMVSTGLVDAFFFTGVCAEGENASGEGISSGTTGASSGIILASAAVSSGSVLSEFSKATQQTQQKPQSRELWNASGLLTLTRGHPYLSPLLVLCSGYSLCYPYTILYDRASVFMRYQLRGSIPNADRSEKRPRFSSSPSSNISISSSFSIVINSLSAY